MGPHTVCEFWSNIFFLNSIIVTPSVYRGQYIGCYYSIVLYLVLYITGFCHANGAVEAPFLPALRGRLCLLPETYEMLVKSCGPELDYQSK